MASFSLNQEFEELVKATLTEKQLMTNNCSNNSNKSNNSNNNSIGNNNKSKHKDWTDGSAKSPDFFQDNKSIKKPERKYTTTRIKSINFPSKKSYVGINKEDFYNEDFTFNIYLLMTKNLNPFSLDRNLNDLNKHEKIYMIWKECIQQLFTNTYVKKKILFLLMEKNVLQPILSEIITGFLKQSEKRYVPLRNNLSQFKKKISICLF